MWWRTEGGTGRYINSETEKEGAAEDGVGEVCARLSSREEVLSKREKKVEEKERVVEQLMASIKEATRDLEEREGELEKLTKEHKRKTKVGGADIIIETLEKQLRITEEAATVHRRNEEDMRRALLQSEEEALQKSQLLQAEITELSLTITELVGDNERLVLSLEAQQEKAIAFKNMSEEVLHELKLKEIERPTPVVQQPSFVVRPFTLDKHTQVFFPDPAHVEVQQLSKKASNLSDSLVSQRSVMASISEALAELTIAAESSVAHSIPGSKLSQSNPQSLRSVSTYAEHLESL